MKIKFLLLISFFILNIKNAQTQSLTIESTIEYINNLFLENPQITPLQYPLIEKQYYRYLLAANGDLTIEYHSDVSGGYYGGVDKNHKEKVNVNDLVLSKIKLHKMGTSSDYSIDNAFLYTIDKWGTEYNFYAHGNGYTQQKFINAYKYLFSLLQQDHKYKRNESDPFSPDNFKSIEQKNSRTKKINTGCKVPLLQEGGVYKLTVKIGQIKKCLF